jgi:uncharacterized protein involved in exopolysaccharide biosynthesis
VRLELTRAGVQEVLSLYSQEQKSAPDEPSFTLRFSDVQRAIEERRRMLVLGIAGGLVLALLVILASTPLYPVSAQVVLERRDVTSSGSSSGTGIAGSAFVATEAEVMQSRSVIADAMASIPKPAFLDEEDDGVAHALEAVRASPVSGTQVVALGYLGEDANHGVQLLTEIVQAYRRALQREEVAIQEEKLGAKQAEISVLNSESADLEKKLLAMRLEHGTLGTAEDTSEAQTILLRDISDQLADARNQRIALENRLASGGNQIAILDPSTRVLQEQLWEAEAELARVRLSLKPRHPAVEAAQRDVSVLSAQLRESQKATPEALRQDIDAMRGLETQLLEVYESERGRMDEIENARREEALLLAELEHLRELSDSRRSELLDQRLVLRLAEAGEVGVTARLIEAPRPPLDAVWPRPIPMLAVGGMLGLLIGFGAALVSLRLEIGAREDVWVPPLRPDRAGAEAQ